MTVSGPPYCQLLMPNNPHIMYNTQHMYQYGDHAGVYFCYPPRKGPFKWRVFDNTYTHAGGKSGRCTNCESYYCKKFSCGDNSFLCSDCDDDDSSDSDGSDNEGAPDDKCCYDDPLCYMIYKHDHSVKAKIQPLHDLYLNAPLKYGLKIKDYMKLTDREALELEKELGGISLFHILEVDMFNGIEDENHPLYSNGRKVEGHDKSLILSGMETIIQLMITQDHAGRVNEHLHSNDIQDLVKQRDDIEKSHTEHIQIDLPLIFLRPSPHPKIPMPTSLPEIKMHHEIDTSSWPAKADETDKGKDKASTNKHTKSRPWTPFTYDMHHGPDTFGTKAVNLYDRPRDYDGDYTFYSNKEHKEAHKRLLNNMDRCTTTVQSKTEPQFNGVFCRYDENESVLFKALQKEGELQHLIKDYKGIKVPDDRMMTRLLIHRTGAKVYRTEGGLTYLYSRNEDCQVTLHQVHSPPGIAAKSFDIANPPSQYKNGFTLQHNRDQDNVMMELESSVTFTPVLFDRKRFDETKPVTIPREIFGTFLPAGKYRLYCLNNTHGSPRGCTKVTKSMILAPFGIRHLQRPGLDGEFHSKKERDRDRNERIRGDESTLDTLLGEEAISCLSSTYYANDIDRFINDLADRIVKKEGAMWLRDPSKDDKSSVIRSKTEVNKRLDNMKVFNCPDEDNICEKLKKKCHEKIGLINDEKNNAYWQQYGQRVEGVAQRAEEAGNKRRKTDK